MRISKTLIVGFGIFLASITLMADIALAQSTFAVRGGRSAASAKMRAQIIQIKNINNNQQTEIDQVKPFAKNLLPTCAVDEALSADGTGFSCVSGGGADDLGDHTATENIALNDYFLSNDGGNEGIRIDNSGNVGIGTPSTGAKLHVDGNIQVSGTITAPEGTLRDDGGGWIRTYGNTGWVSHTYGGGWYMSDITWVRSWANKNVYTAGAIRADSGIHTNQVCNTSGNNCVAQTALGGTPSDIRLKGEVLYIDSQNALQKILTLRGISFNWKDSTRGTAREIGLIAQDVEKVYPEAVTDSTGGYKTLNYESLMGPLVEAIKEQQKQIDLLMKEISSLKSAQ